MEIFDLAFKATAVLHTAAGYMLFGLAANDEMRPEIFYKDRNPLVGDIYKYVTYASCWSLIACGFLAFLMPDIAVLAAWAAIGFYLLTALVPFKSEPRWPSLSKASAITLAVRLIAAAALTTFYRHASYG